MTPLPIDTIRELASRFDDASLEHLANKGLVRRAKKLVDESVAVEPTELGCAVQGDGWSVEFDAQEALQDGTCACSTAGICQHLLAGIMRLRKDAPSAPAAEGDGDPAASGIQAALLELSDEQLLGWTKLTDGRWAASRVDAIEIDAIEIEESSYLRVGLPSPHPVVQFMTNDLDQAIVKPGGRNDRRAIALAVVAIWARTGRQLVLPASSSNAPINELVQERGPILRRVEQLAQDVLTSGLLHIAEPEAERMGSLAASLRGVKLYRMSLLAERIADQMDALADLSPAADTSLVLEQLAELVVVAQATVERIESGIALPQGLTGVARAGYEPVGVLDLVGLGNYAWGDARFAGTTTVAAQSASVIYSVSSPRMAKGRPLADPPRWSGVGSPDAISGHRFQLSDARASLALRLSSSGKSMATLGASVSADDLASLAWDGSSPSRGSRLLGSPSSRWVVLALEAQREALGFDPIDQALVWEVQAAGTPVTVRLPFTTHARKAIETLELFVTTRLPAFVCGRLRASTAGLELWPISIYTDKTFVNLSSPPEKKAGRLSGLFGSRTDSDQPDLTVEPPRHLDRISDELTRLAEGGRRAATDEALNEMSRTASHMGLAVIASAIDHSPLPQIALLRASWLVQLSKELD